MRFGMTTMAVEPPDRFRRLVEIADGGGCDYLWVCDSSLHARDVYSYLTVAALASENLRIGPNCTHPYTRHPAINLNAMATIHELSGGRGIVAVATGDRPVMELGYPMARVAVVREMIEVIRALEAGETVTREGETFTLDSARLCFDLPVPLPLYLAASGPRMLRMGGELADGVLFLAGVHEDCVRYAMERIREGAEETGRDPDALDIGCTVYGSLQDDTAAARALCRPMAAWFPQTSRQYAEIAGVEEERIENIRAAYAGGHFDQARAAMDFVTDDMIDAFTVGGPPEVWIDRLNRIAALGIEHINVFLLGPDRAEMGRRLVEDVFPHIGRG